MIKLSKCCWTCGNAAFCNGAGTTLCDYWTKKTGRTVEVNKTFTCEHWFDAQKGDKKWSWISPKKRLVWWKKRIDNLNQLIFDKLGSLK